MDDTNKRQVRSQSEKRKCDYNFSYNTNPHHTIDRSRGIDRIENVRDIDEVDFRTREVVEIHEERQRQSAERYVPKLNSKKNSPDSRYNYKAIVEDIAKIMGVLIINLE
jgi:hypothetical protein